MPKKSNKTTVAVRNPMATVLASGANRPQVVKPKKGKGSWKRNPKHKGEE